VSTVSGGVALAAAEAMLAAQKEAKAPVVDFYRFQRREQRRSELLDLRSKFEQDKKKVAEMRAGRNFKPF
jgi:ribosomal RNA-processing protein 7